MCIPLQAQRVAAATTDTSIPEMPTTRPIPKDLADMQKEYKEFVKMAHDDPAFDGFDWSPQDLADAELELETIEEGMEEMAFDLQMADVTPLVQKAGESRVAFMQRVTGRPTPEGVDVEWVDRAFEDIEPPPVGGAGQEHPYAV